MSQAELLDLDCLDPKLAAAVHRDLRVAFIAVRSRSAFASFLPELYTGVEEEGGQVSSVLRDLRESGLVLSMSGSYSFKRCCERWKVWVALRDFEERFPVFSAAELSGDNGSVWVRLRKVFAEGRLPDFRDEAFSFAFVREAAGNKDEMDESSTALSRQQRAIAARGVSYRGGNRKQLSRLRLGVWLQARLEPVVLYRFLRPYFPDTRPLTKVQVYRELRRARMALKGGEASRSFVIVEDSQDAEHARTRGDDKRAGKDSGIYLENDLQGRNVAIPMLGGAIAVPASVDRAEGMNAAKNGLLKHFGDLPRGGTVDEFLSSPGGAKLRSGAFWRSVAEAAGADFSGNIEFGGLNVGVGPGGLGNLLAWCESFSLALTSALDSCLKNHRHNWLKICRQQYQAASRRLTMSWMARSAL